MGDKRLGCPAVVGADAGSKLAKAQSLGVRILDEAALEQILKTRRPPDPA